MNFRSRRWRTGVSSLEFALIMPVFITILIGVADWGLAMDRRLQLQTAVRAGAQHAMRAPSDTNGTAAAVRAAAPDLGDRVTVGSTGLFCECGSTAVACTGTCTSGMQRFVRVTATLPYTPFSPVGPTSVAANVTLRIQ